MPLPHRLRRRGRLVATGLLLAAAVVGCGKAPEPASAPAAAPAEPPRVVVLGLDAGTLDLLGPWMDRGLLPNLARIRAEGVHGVLRSTQPSSSPVIWTSIATGKVPEKTGITWFLRFPDGPGKPSPVDRRQRKTAALWNMMTSRRIDVAAVGWYVTWPAESVSGRIVSDLAHYGRAPGATFPDEYLWDVKPVPESAALAAMPSFMDHAYDATKAAPPAAGAAPSLDYLVHDRFVRAWSRDRFYLDAAKRVLSDGPLPEAFFLYLRGTDDVQHGFWKFMEPAAFAPRPGPDGKAVPGTTEVPADQARAFGKVIERYWQWIDTEVGAILARYAKSPPLVIVCSDHGAGPAVGEFGVEVPEYLHLSGAHRVDGMLLASGPGIRRAAPGAPPATIEGATIYDVAPTILAALGLPVGRDMDGKVLTGLFEEPLASRPVATVETWDSPATQPAEATAISPAVDQKVMEHLKSLGYIQ